MLFRLLAKHAPDYALFCPLTPSSLLITDPTYSFVESCMFEVPGLLGAQLAICMLKSMLPTSCLLMSWTAAAAIVRYRA
jgi:hypothetical protein